MEIGGSEVKILQNLRVSEVNLTESKGVPETAKAGGWESEGKNGIEVC